MRTSSAARLPGVALAASLAFAACAIVAAATPTFWTVATQAEFL
jgi:uncharacterized membrane protein